MSGTGSPPLLEMAEIVKTFPGGVVANDHVTFEVSRGEIHGLLGENGAGKSTLMKILFGLYVPDAGEIHVNGDPIDIDTPGDAIEKGIGMVHQHFKLIPRFTVVENIILGRQESAHENSVLKWVTRDTAGPIERINELVDTYGLDIDPQARVGTLDIGEQQRVEILKSLYLDTDLLILDEPTAALTPQQTTVLFETLQKLVDDGLSIVFITHKLEEVTEITDRVTVLRDGKVVDTVSTDSVSRADLAKMMVGRDILFDTDKDPVSVSETVLNVRDLRTSDYRGNTVLDDVSLQIQEGEIVGVAGVSGNGQTDLAECLVGTEEPDRGSIKIKGTEMAGESTRSFIDAGVSYIPEDRVDEGSVPDMSVMHNCVLKDYRSFMKNRLLDYDAIREYAERLVEDYDIRVPSVDVPAKNLSGGNLQKVILARELSREPDLLVANNPTQGLDVGAIEHVRDVLLNQRKNGTGIFLISEDLDEVLQMSDRLLVIFDGQIVHQTPIEGAEREMIGQYMTQGQLGSSHTSTRARREVSPDGN